MMDSKKILVSCALVASLGLFGIAGCSSGAASSSASASASASSSAASEEVMQVSESAPELQAVGASSDAAATFELTNKTGADITVVSVKAAGAADYSANMLAANQKIANGETVLFNCPKIEAQSTEQSGDQAEASAQSADVALNDMVDVKIELADGKSYELHQVTVGKVTSATVALSEGLAFLEYKDAQGGSTVSTLESEKAIAKAAEEAAAAERAAQEEQAAQAAPQGDANYQEPVYYDDAAYVDDTAYANTSGNGGGDGAACVDDIVLNF